MPCGAAHDAGMLYIAIYSYAHWDLGDTTRSYMWGCHGWGCTCHGYRWGMWGCLSGWAAAAGLRLQGHLRQAAATAGYLAYACQWPDRDTRSLPTTTSAQSSPASGAPCICSQPPSSQQRSKPRAATHVVSTPTTPPRNRTSPLSIDHVCTPLPRAQRNDDARCWGSSCSWRHARAESVEHDAWCAAGGPVPPRGTTPQTLRRVLCIQDQVGDPQNTHSMCPEAWKFYVSPATCHLHVKHCLHGQHLIIHVITNRSMVFRTNYTNTDMYCSAHDCPFVSCTVFSDANTEMDLLQH